MRPDPVAVQVAKLTEQHLIVVDGSVNEIVVLADDRTRVSYTARLLEDRPIHEMPLDPGGLIPCVRRADWRVS